MSWAKNKRASENKLSWKPFLYLLERTFSMKQLLEWKDEQGNKLNIRSSSTTTTSSNAPTSPTLTTPNYKDKFKSLLDYHVNNLSSTVLDYEIKQIADDRFHIQEKIKGGGDIYVRDIVAVIIETGEWVIAIYIDGQPYKVFNSGDGGWGIQNLLKQLEGLNILKFPSITSKEYKAIMAEDVSFAEDFRLYENLWN